MLGTNADSVPPKPMAQNRFQFEAMQALKSIMHLLKDCTFSHHRPFIQQYTLDYIRSKPVVDYVGHTDDPLDNFEDSDDDSALEDLEDEDDNKKYELMSIELAFDIFSYLSQRISFDSEAAVNSQQDFIESIFAALTKNQDWKNETWMTYVMLLIVCNGGSQVGTCEIIEDSWNTRLMRVVQDTLSQKVSDGQPKQYMDYEMLYCTINSILSQILYVKPNTGEPVLVDSQQDFISP